MLQIQRRASQQKHKITGYFKRREVTLYQQPPCDKVHALIHHTLECIAEEEEEKKKWNQTKPVTEELNKVSPLITRVWTGLRQEKPWPLAGSRCGGPKGGGPQPHQTPKSRADRPALLPVAAAARSLFGHSEAAPRGRTPARRSSSSPPPSSSLQL